MSRPGSSGAGVKVTATAPANIAFIKYWGTRDLERVIPFNHSISMTLSRCVSRSTVEVLGPGGDDEILLLEEGGELQPAPAAFRSRVERHLARLREWAGSNDAFRVVTRNSFPIAAGIASSASGFAALTLAVTRALGHELPPDSLSVLARRSGSGSAARSVLGGYVEWPGGSADAGEGGSAVSLAPAEHWDLRDVIALVETSPKRISSLEGHRRAVTSPYFERRLSLLPERLGRTRRAIAERRLDVLGPLLEEEAVDLHLIAMSSHPPIFYWRPGSLAVQEAVRDLRRQGAPAYFTMDAGANVHVLCLPADEEAVAARLESLPQVASILRDGVGPGPEVGGDPLF